MEIELSKILDNPYQPRTTDNAEHIESLARSIAADGLLQVPTARKMADGTFQLAFGHSRRKAFEWLKANWTTLGLTNRYDAYCEMPINLADLTDEDMYRFAVSENVQRKDLDAIEVARSMKRYGEEFGKNSDEVGDLFRMSGSTVRGKLRLLDLPEKVQDALTAGEISEGTARSLLSMRKVASDDDVVKTLKYVLERKDQLPDDVIEHQIERLPNVVDMWNDDNRDGKPKSSYHGWHLDMKNLPARLLPKMSVETAGAYEAQLEHLTNPPACTACPFYIKMRGNHYCGMKVCHERKSIAWQDHSVELASKKTKIAIYSEEDGAYRPLEYSDKKLFEKGHKDLRLAPKRTVNGYAYQDSFTKLDDDLVVVVATRDALNKMSVSGGATRGGKKTEKEKAEARAMKIYRVRRKELLWAFTACAKLMFDAVPGAALERMSSWRSISVDDLPPVEKPSETDKTAFGEYLRHLLVWKMIIEGSSTYRRETLTSVLEGLQGFAKKWNMKVPTVITKLAEQFDAEIESIVAVETDPAEKKKVKK